MCFLDRVTFRIAAAGMAILICRGGYAKDLNQSAARQDAIVAAEQSDIRGNVAARMRAFSAITQAIPSLKGRNEMDPDAATASAKHAITELLRQETPDPYPPKESASSQAAPDDGGDQFDAEAFGNYLSSLIDAVAQLHDPDSIKLLYNPYILETGGMAEQGLAYFGRTQARRVVGLYQRTPEGPYRDALAVVMQEMLIQHKVDDPSTLAEMEKIYLAESHSSSANTRQFAARSLSYFKDSQAKARLSELAASDPAFIETRIKQVRHYPVREDASAALHEEFTGGVR